MALCFAGFAVGSACLTVALVGDERSLTGHIGLAFLLVTAIGLALAACFRMDPVSTLPKQMSFRGKMHGFSFLISVPCQVLAVLLLSLALSNQPSYASQPLFVLTSVIWLSLVTMIAIMLMVGPGKAPNPDGPERYLGLPNRLFMVAYGVWLIVTAWPIAR
jgi:hypothetical protein